MTCLCIDEYVGLSIFSCYVHTHFSHSEHPWWIQEGTTQINHLWDPKIQYQEITHTNWLSDDETAAPWDWPQQNAILVDNQSPLRSCKGYAEKLIISRVCCQIIQTCICDTPAPWSCAARNFLKQTCWTMKARILEGIHRRSVEDSFVPKVHFEWDQCLPTYIPGITKPSMVHWPAAPETWRNRYTKTIGYGPPPNIWTPNASCIPQTPMDLRMANGEWSAAPTQALLNPPRSSWCQV